MRAAPLFALALLAGCARPAAESAPASTAGERAPAAADTPRARAVTPANNPAIGDVSPPTDRTIAADLAAVPRLAGLARAVAAAGMTDTLSAAGPFTLFAPTEEAFGRLQPGTVEALVKPENRASLVRLLSLHIVPERLGGLELMRRIATGGGRATLTTVAGEPLTVTLTGGIVTLTDAGGNKSYVEVADVRASNGVIHVVNGVLIPRLN